MIFWYESRVSAYNFRLEYGIAKRLASYYRVRLTLSADIIEFAFKVLRETHPFPGDGHIWNGYTHDAYTCTRHLLIKG